MMCKAAHPTARAARGAGRHPIAPVAALLAPILVALGMAAAPPAVAQVHACGEIGKTRGDYISDRRNLKIVEDYHFTPQVENLIRGQSSVNIGADLNYTLRSFPNHHRALMALVRLSERERTPRPAGAAYSVECYFDRALRFRPDDTVARMLYAHYLFKNGRTDDAKAQLARTARDAGDSPLTHFNLGLLHLEMKNYEDALRHAHKAQALGLQRPELREKLKQAGHWREPAPDQGDSSGRASAGDAPPAPR